MWLNNIYNVHRRLSMAFPIRERKESDPHFLQPFDPTGFESRQFLFRVDNNVDGAEKRAVIIVQSSLVPDWDYAFHNASGFLAAKPETKKYDPQFTQGQQLRFRVRINPSVKRNVEEKASSPEGLVKTGNILHKRVSLTWDEDSNPEVAIADWFARKSARLGFTPLRTELVQLGWEYGSKPEAKGELPRRENKYMPMKFRSALLEGILCVEDPVLFPNTLSKGIGTAKGMGFGLLSVIQLPDAE
jgi:CRISPR system Cascade subunit CasE